MSGWCHSHEQGKGAVYRGGAGVNYMHQSALCVYTCLCMHMCACVWEWVVIRCETLRMLTT